MARRGATSLSGILPLDKPAGMTSHDVVGFVRRLTGERRVGHAGTLDPAATGLLVVLVGPMTRLARFLEPGRKTYLSEIAFGRETSTDDAEGETSRIAHVPASLAAEDAAAAALEALVGAHEQVPPAYSAVKIRGRKAYDVARGGGTPELSPRPVEVFAARLLAIVRAPDLRWQVEITCSKGTYVRALARDLGRSMGSAAHLSALRRTASGRLTLDDAATLEEAERAATGPAGVASLFTNPVDALGLPTLELPPEGSAAFANGKRIAAAAETDEDLVAVVREDALLGVGRVASGILTPEVVLGARGEEAG